MTAESIERSDPPGLLRRIVTNPFLVWVGFVLVHLWLGLVNLFADNVPLGDVTIVYRFWMHQASQGTIVGIDIPWVYPILAIVPMILAYAFGPELAASTWLSMVMVLNAVALGFITAWGRDRRRVPMGWWWIGFLLVLGPIALGRIDSVTVPIAMLGVLLLASRPRVAAGLLAAATWMKVWPAAILLAAVVATRDRARIVAVALAVSAIIIIGALLLGSGANVASFITTQTDRGLQVEAPIGTIWLWRAMLGEPGTYVYYNADIVSFQITGAGTTTAASIMMPLLAIVVAMIALVGVVAMRRGAPTGALLPPLALALVVSFIAFNKVGSPQFISWLAVPIVLGLATRLLGGGRSFRTPAAIVLVIALLTQAIYPYLYDQLLGLNPILVLAVTARNVLYFVLLGWAIHAVHTSPRVAEVHDDDTWAPTTWPLGPARQ